MKWLSRKIKLLDSFSPQKWEVRFTDIEPCSCDKHELLLHHMRLKNYVSHLITHSHNIAMWTAAHALISFQNRLDISFTVIPASRQPLSFDLMKNMIPLIPHFWFFIVLSLKELNKSWAVCCKLSFHLILLISFIVVHFWQQCFVNP